MTSKLETELYRAAVLTFEDLSLMLPSPGVEPWQRDAQATSAVHITFSGPFCGGLMVCIHGELLPVIAANMLGQLETPTLQEQLDALGEIANVVCGNMLPGIGGSEAVFHIAAPSIINVDEVIKAESSAAARVHIGLEQGFVKLLLLMNKT